MDEREGHLLRMHDLESEAEMRLVETERLQKTSKEAWAMEVHWT
jgi:hypothetical protein